MSGCEKIESTTKSKVKSKKGGARPGAGRKPKVKMLSNYEKAIRLLDDNVESAIQVLVDGLKNKSLVHRIKCAEILLKKTLPDRKDIHVKGIVSSEKDLSNLSKKELKLLKKMQDKIIVESNDNGIDNTTNTCG